MKMFRIKMETLVRKLIFWAFKKRVLVYKNVFVISEFEMQSTKYPRDFFNENLQKRLNEFAKRLFEEGAIELQAVQNPRIGAQEYTLKIKVFK